MTEKRELPRSEQVRTRQAQKNTKRLKQATERAYKPMASARSKSFVAAKHKRAPVDRRYNIALGLLPGVNIGRPTFMLPELRAGWRTASLLLTILLGAAIYFAWTLPYFHASSAVVMGNERFTPEEINSVMGIAGQSIFTIRPADVVSRLRMNYPELASAQVNVYFPNQVYVTVTERQPVILWQQGDGFAWIASDGVAFRPHGSTPMLVPVVGLALPPAGVAPLDDPFSPAPYITKELVDAILTLAPNLPAGVSMTYDPKNGLGWTDPRGWQVFFGTSSKNAALKVRVYQALVDSLVARGISPAFISVEYADAPYYRMAQQSSTSDGSGQ